MNMLESVPAVRRIDTGRRDLHAFDIVGHVTAADVENLFGLLEAACAIDPRIDVLLRVVDNEGVDWREVSPDTMKQGKALASEHVRRCALVGDRAALAATHGVFLNARPVEFREFAPEDEDGAWDWLEGE
ncbi:STAS/SEC14 domain-containing protein [Mesorhizobium sp. LHD-90]|uniref:STAS/SEC14 domain-containing protein n=1 Tax=Mesorhizobium sp. LHD-90 TaxID=3071414 RepID=UPI0027DF760B|nr:STAS/SEC14 domain-containing protein [Mesorhizobium sp. LHD-90]MDQ6433560.1 STAS/SEC14 domain-containing protein [Mesorhizobium sp. LHD-90]